jgi:hypothetical protein
MKPLMGMILILIILMPLAVFSSENQNQVQENIEIQKAQGVERIPCSTGGRRY